MYIRKVRLTEPNLHKKSVCRAAIQAVILCAGHMKERQTAIYLDKKKPI